MKLILIKSRITDLMLFTSAHGFPRMIRTNRILIKALWIIFLVITSGFCVYFLNKTIVDYLNYDVTTSITIVQEQFSKFPTISICSTLGSMNYSLDRFIFKCEFNEDLLTQSDLNDYFSTFEHPKYGRCYKFNSGTNMLGEKKDILETRQSGVKNGLVIDIRFDDFSINDFGELIVYFHNSSINSSHLYFMDSNGYYLSSGTFNFFLIDRIYDINLPEPYSDCLKDVATFKHNKTIIDFLASANSIYSQTLCLRLCTYLHLVEESGCGCEVNSLDQVPAKCSKQWNRQKKNYTLMDCSINFFNQFKKNSIYLKCGKYCPLECDSIKYRILPHSEAIPQLDGNISNSSRYTFNFYEFDTYADVRRRYISFAVNYEELQYTFIQREPKIEAYNLVSNIGGTFSLFLGVSFISFIELIEILLEIIYILFDKKLTRV